VQGDSPDRVVIRGARLLDLSAAEGISAPVDIVVEGGAIAGLDACSRVPPPDCEVIEAAGSLAMPGLVNAHFHSSGTFNRGLVDNLPLELFMLYEMPPFDFGPFPADLYRARVLLGGIEMLKTGVTAVLDDPIYSPEPSPDAIDAVMGAYRDCGLRATVTIYQPNTPEHSWFPYIRELLPQDVLDRLEREAVPSTDEIMATYEGFVRRWHGAEGGRLRCGVSCSAPQRATDDYMLRLHDLASRERLPFNLHIYESKVQRVAGDVMYRKSLVRHVRELGVLDDLSVIAHAVWVDGDDIGDIAAAGAVVVHSPSGNLRCGSGIMPFRSLLDAGVPVALCTDEATVEDTSSLWNVGRLAALLHKIDHPDYTTWPTAAEILESMTVAGARAMGLEDEIGRLRVGGRADIILVDLDSPTYTPFIHLPHHLVYGEDGRSVWLVMVDGRVVVRDGRVLTVDEQAVRAEVRELMPGWLEALEPATQWARRLHPAFEEVVRRCAVADTGVNRWAGNEGEWLAAGRPGWRAPRGGLD
jgi:5-methylthioadenosine/S-adenosylhomocysteine deaminase